MISRHRNRNVTDVYLQPCTVGLIFSQMRDGLPESGRALLAYEEGMAPSNYRLCYHLLNRYERRLDEDPAVIEQEVATAGFPYVVVLKDQPSRLYSSGILTPLTCVVSDMADVSEWTTFETTDLLYFCFSNEVDAVRFKLVAEDLV